MSNMCWFQPLNVRICCFSSFITVHKDSLVFIYYIYILLFTFCLFFYQCWVLLQGLVLSLTSGKHLYVCVSWYKTNTCGLKKLETVGWPTFYKGILFGPSPLQTQSSWLTPGGLSWALSCSKVHKLYKRRVMQSGSCSSAVFSANDYKLHRVKL